MKQSVSVVVVLFLTLVATSARAGLDEARKAFLRGDYATALREWRPLAGQGVAKAQYNLGQMYKLGLGVPQDYIEAIRWYRKASVQGDINAHHNVGGALYSGKGVSQDYGEAAHWFHKAAYRGHEQAQFNLGLMYARGEGVGQNDVHAYKWFLLAASRAPPPGKNRHRMKRSLGFVAERMTPAQVTEALRLAHEWLATFQEARIRH
jgi:TPR repeat protein